MDRLTLSGMKFYSHSGLFSFEKDVGQLFEIDVDCYVDLAKAARTDKVGDTVNYPLLFQAVKKIMEHSSFNLMERLAGEIAETALRDFPIRKITVRCRKPRVPVKGFIDYAEVEICREK
ncbi:MAG: dihydroneopterin aldolase [Candidatus Glassbacteria bacterium]|nr:dihydroneopterin aldolase [Candidatus Glassbacteria bacterium]